MHLHFEIESELSKSLDGTVHHYSAFQTHKKTKIAKITKITKKTQNVFGRFVRFGI